VTPTSRRLFLVLALLAAALFALGALIDVHALRLASKPWPVVLLAAWVWRDAPADRYRSAMIAGLVCSLAGDMFLETSPRGLFLPGLVSFLVAHVFYVLAYLLDTRALEPLRALPAYAYGATLVAVLWPGLGSMAIPVAIYAAVICTMLYRAAARLGRVAAASGRLALVGAITFAASDSLIAIGRFGGHLVEETWRTSTPWRLAIMTTYWLGQWAIAASSVTRRAAAPPA
jgi:uncharacterized membrane protein YhhN